MKIKVNHLYYFVQFTYCLISLLSMWVIIDLTMRGNEYYLVIAFLFFSYILTLLMILIRNEIWRKDKTTWKTTQWAFVTLIFYISLNLGGLYASLFMKNTNLPVSVFTLGLIINMLVIAISLLILYRFDKLEFLLKNLSRKYLYLFDITFVVVPFLMIVVFFIFYRLHEFDNTILFLYYIYVVVYIICDYLISKRFTISSLFKIVLVLITSFNLFLIIFEEYLDLTSMPMNTNSSVWVFIISFLTIFILLFSTLFHKIEVKNSQIENKFQMKLRVINSAIYFVLTNLLFILLICSMSLELVE